MAGGQGTRFWPESTKKKPKQYLDLVGGESLLAQTMNRFEGIAHHYFIVTTKDQLEMCLKSQDKAQKDNIILEPMGRNTAPCIFLSLLSLLNRGAGLDDIVAVVPSDHVILNKKGYQKVMQKAIDVALEYQQIVTIGIRPNVPHTGYGYIEQSQELAPGVFIVDSFKEKPDFNTASHYVSCGHFLWNAGMFVSSIRILLEELSLHAPDVYCHRNDLERSLGCQAELEQVYSRLPKISIDYAVMEKSKKVLVIYGDFDWNDLGSWEAFEQVLGETQNNTIVKAKHFYQKEAFGNIVFAPDQLVALVGVKDLVVVHTKEALMVIPKNRTQEVKDIVAYLEDQEFGQQYL